MTLNITMHLDECRASVCSECVVLLVLKIIIMVRSNAAASRVDAQEITLQQLRLGSSACAHSQENSSQPGLISGTDKILGSNCI